MYLKTQFRETRKGILHGLVRTHPLATFIAVVDSAIVVDHMPFLISDDGGEYGTLRGHIPRANQLWPNLDGRLEAVAVFQGPERYISPSWYPGKHVHGKVVPTWNYAVVHAHGAPRVIEDPGWLLGHLNALTDSQESGRSQPWQVSDAPESYISQMIEHIVGIEMPIRTMFGKWKVSQNRPLDDRFAVAAGLHSQGDEASLEMEGLVKERSRPD